MKANDLHQFKFYKVSYGCYRVTYTTEKRGDYWTANICDMPMIDATLNAEWAKAQDIENLRKFVKLHGAHYSRYGERLD